MQIEMNKEILQNIKQRIINYLIINNCKDNRILTLINERMNNIKHLYVENLTEKSMARMVCREDNIAIDEQFVVLSEDKKRIIKIKDNFMNVVSMQLCHELWHAASSHDGITGIMKSYQNNQVVENRKFLALNEGITQMLTEKAHGLKLSKFTDRTYRHFKYMAEIITLSTSFTSILKSYLFNSFSLKNELNGLSNNEFYEFFNVQLTNMFNGLRYLKYNETSPVKPYFSTLANIYNVKMKNMYKYLLINIVLPKIKSLDKNNQQKYIKDILSVAKEDNGCYEIINEYLNRIINMNDNEISKEKENIKNNLLIREEQLEFIQKLFVNDKETKANIIVKNDGTINYNKNGKTITISNQLSELIYTQLHFINPINIDYSKINLNINYRFDCSRLNILQKRKLFCGLKYFYEKNGYHIINSYDEFDNESEIKLLRIKKHEIPNLEDLRTISSHFITNNQNNKVNYINNKTKKAVNSESIKIILSFTNIWNKSCKSSGYDPYDNNIKPLYNDIIETMKKGIYSNGNLNIDELINKYKNTEFYNIIINLFYTREKYEAIYNYMLIGIDDNKKVMQYNTEQCIEERKYGDFRILSDSEIISSKI